MPSSAGTRGISRPRYWISGRPPSHSTFSHSISSSARDEGEGHGLEAVTALNTSSVVVASAMSASAASASAAPSPPGRLRLPDWPHRWDRRSAPRPRRQGGVAGNQRDVPQLGRHRLHDDLSVWKTSSTRMPKRWRPTWATTTKPEVSPPPPPEQAGEGDDRQQPLAQAQDRRAVDALDGLRIRRRPAPVRAPPPAAGRNGSPRPGRSAPRRWRASAGS